MPKTYTPPQPFSDKPRPAIALTAISEERSSQIAAIGYDEATLTLAIQFRRGAGAIYHYRGVPRTGVDPSYESFMTADSLGNYHGQHLKALTFDKFPAETAEVQS